MPRLKLGIKKVSIRLYEGQKEELVEVFGSGYNATIRELIDEALTRAKKSSVLRKLPKRMARTKYESKRLQSKLKVHQEIYKNLDKQFAEDIK